jgi:hypothetical protein
MREYTTDYDINLYNREVHEVGFNYTEEAEAGLSDLHLSVYHLVRDSAGHLVADTSYEYAGLHIPLDEVLYARKWFKEQFDIWLDDDDAWGCTGSMTELPSSSEAPWLYDLFSSLPRYEIEREAE